MIELAMNTTIDDSRIGSHSAVMDVICDVICPSGAGEHG
jgi:hypothetical protein